MSLATHSKRSQKADDHATHWAMATPLAGCSSSALLEHPTIHLLGERHSGTNLLQWLLNANYEVNVDARHKHLFKGGAPLFVNAKGERGVLLLNRPAASAETAASRSSNSSSSSSSDGFAVIFRHPVRWLLSLWRMPHNMLPKLDTFDAFVRRDGRSWQRVAIGPTRAAMQKIDDFDDLYALRATKAREMLSLGRGQHARFAAIRFEDLLADTEAALAQLTRPPLCLALRRNSSSSASSPSSAQEAATVTATAATAAKTFLLAPAKICSTGKACSFERDPPPPRESVEAQRARLRDDLRAVSPAALAHVCKRLDFHLERLMGYTRDDFDFCPEASSIVLTRASSAP